MRGEQHPQVDLGALDAAQVGRRRRRVGRSRAGDEAAQRALLLGGDDRQLGRLAPDLVAAAVDVGQRLEHPVVHDPGDPLALVQPLALEQHLLLAASSPRRARSTASPISPPSSTSSTMLCTVDWVG